MGASRSTVCDGVLVIGADAELRAQTYEAPTWHRDVGPIVAVDAQPGLIGALGRDGHLRVFASSDGTPGVETSVKGSSVVGGNEGTWLVLDDSRLSIVRDGAIRHAIEIERAAVAAFDGEVWFVATTDGHAWSVDGTGTAKRLTDPPEPVLAVAALAPNEWLAIGTTSVMRLEKKWSTPMTFGDDVKTGTFLAASGDGARVAWLDTTNSLVTARSPFTSAECLATWSTEDSASGPLVVCGLGFFATDQITVAFTNGRSHFIDLERGPMMMDRFEDDPLVQWVFFYGEDTCIGGDEEAPANVEPIDDAWMASQIGACDPPSAVTAPVQNLFEAVLFCEGRRRSVFGVEREPSSFDTTALRALAIESLARWAEHFANDPINSPFVEAKRLRIDLGFAPPPTMQARLVAREERDRALRALPEPLEFAPSDADGLFEDLDPSAIVDQADFVLPTELRGALVDFEWVEPDDGWSIVPDVFFDPNFLPLGGADGDLVGLYLHAASLAAGLPAPVVYYFHEHDPPFSFLAESLSRFDDMIRIASRTKGKTKKRTVIDEARGVLHPAIRDALEATRLMSDAPLDEERELVHELIWESDATKRENTATRLEALYQKLGHRFGIASLRAQAIERKYATQRPRN